MPGAAARIGTPAALRDHLTAAIEADAPAKPEHRVRFGPHGIALVLHGRRETPSCLGALRSGAEGPRAGSCAFTIHVLDGEACAIARPRLAWSARDFGPKRAVPGWSDAELTVFFLRSHQGLAIVDWRASRAILWVPSLRSIPYYEHAAPLRWLFDVLAPRFGMYTLHAACVGRPDCGLLIAGASGSGKSTLALSAAALGLRYAGDDYCLLEPGRDDRAHCLYTTGKWRPDGAVRPLLAGGLAPRMSPSARQKSVVFLADGARGSLIGEMPLRGIVVPEFTSGPRATLEPVPAHLAFRQLGPSTMAQSEAETAPLAAAIAGLSRRLPAYRLGMPPDPRAAVAALEALAERLGAGAEAPA